MPKIDGRAMIAEAERAKGWNEQFRSIIWDAVRVVSFRVETRVKEEMPVDTGRARASWGHQTDPAEPGDGIWNEDARSMSIEQGSNVEYIEALNEGHSRQAPAGFIDAIAYAAEDMFVEEIEARVDRSL